MICKKFLTRAVVLVLSVGFCAAPMPEPFAPFTTLITWAEAARTTGLVILVGNLQDELGGAKEWDPADTKTQMKNIGDGKYQFTGQLPAGNYEFKVAIGGSWSENYGEGGKPNGANMQLHIKAPHEVTCTYDAVTDRVA